MSMNTLSLPADTTLARSIIDRMRRASPSTWWTVIAFTVLGVTSVGAQYADPRLINGVNVWLKPAKFFISLAIQFATVAWAMSYLPAAERQLRAVRWPVAVMLCFGWMEMVYIVYRAAQGETSHYNVSDLLGQIAYPTMGIAATSMTLIAGYIGFRLWRHRGDGLWTEAASIGLIFGTLLGTAAGFYMSAQPGHSVGGAASDATGTGLFSWSTTGGDLRIAHFVGLHAAQIIPFAALSNRRTIVWAVAGLCTVLTLATFVLATMGIPLFRNG